MKTFNDKIAFIGLLLAIVAMVAALLTPEIRTFLGLEHELNKSTEYPKDIDNTKGLNRLETKKDALDNSAKNKNASNTKATKSGTNHAENDKNTFKKTSAPIVSVTKTNINPSDQINIEEEKEAKLEDCNCEITMVAVPSSFVVWGKH
ncbi:MAG: hypothetical protein IT258_17285, partial [Saprospiraceae bacterium]|nr:hypothetical protein [Saprospiraceae bacterium]